MFCNPINENIWDAYISEFVYFIDLGENESKAPQNEQVEILQPQKFKDKKIFEDTDGEYVDFVEL